MAKMFKNKTISSAVAIFTAAVILMTVFMVAPLSVFSKEPADCHIVKDGEQISSLLLVEDEKILVNAVSNTEVKGYRWQIVDSDNSDRWFDISGTFSSELSVSYALVGSMLKADGTTAIRCKVTTAEDEVIYTTPVDITVSYKVKEAPHSAIGTIQSFTDAPSVYTARARGRAAVREDEHITYTVVINYLFDNNGIAFEPYGASIAAGSDFHAVVKSPTVLGYAPFRRDGVNYIDATEVVIDLKNIQENVTINVIYEPTLVDFQIHHHLQNLHDDEYSLHADKITYSKAITGTVVGDGLAFTEEELPGFKALAYEKLTVAADGSTVIEIRYDRNYYLVDFDMAGGYGTEPVYTRYGETVGANTPIRHGYVFDGWELISYGGQTPTAEQKSKYDISDGKTIILPDANLRYKARWITQNTTYTMVFWKENANDNGYSYWGYLDGLSALSGSYVSGQNYISRVSGIDDEQYFTFNSEKTDKNVLVEGDGSTVVNVYYTRNYYKLTFKANAKCAIPTNHTHNDDCYDEICGLGHTHDASCSPTLSCGQEEHTAHTEACFKTPHEEHIHGSLNCDCNLTEHTHTKDCWNYVGTAQSSVTGAPKNPEEGQVYRRNSNNYYIYIKGTWYKYNSKSAPNGSIVDPNCGKSEHAHGTNCACAKENHTHSDSCYRDVLHTHSAVCYTYSCGEIEHIHSDACYRLKCGIEEKHSHSTNCNSTSKSNTIKVVYRKYEQSIEDLWPVKTDHETPTVYDGGQRWKPSGSTTFTQVMVYAATMTPENFTLTLDEASYTPYVMNYWLQVLDGDDYDRENNGKYYKLSHTIKAKYNYVTKAEDFFDIAGFDQYSSNPNFSGSQISISGTNRNVDFYYTRKTDHYLRFNNNGTVLDDKSVYGIMFGAPLTSYNFTPEYPNNLEPNAYSFAGWYTSPGCFTGTEVNWNTLTMTDGDLMLYAKWAPITHTVKIFKDANLTEQIGATQIVDHKAFATAPTEQVENGNFVFQGWFYKDRNGEEKAFVFTGIPVNEDMNIYAKWSSHVSVDYKIHYKLFNTNTTIADSTYGSAIAGHNKTFDAKAGDQLYEGYQTGFYPLTNSHTITMSVDGTHEFTFYYVYVESMPYIVEYIDANTGAKLYEDKLVKENTLSVVTETFVKYEGKMPDAYQKRLVLSASGEDKNNDGVLDQNKITFYYESDEVHAYYRVVHYIRNITGNTYREYRSEEFVGIIGDTYSVDAITLTGFEFMGEKTLVDGVATPAVGNTVSAQLGADGLLIELFYDRILVDYTVKYLDSATGQPIIPDRIASGVFGEQVLEYAADLSGIGYSLASDNLKMLTLSTNMSLNTITFLYQEHTVSVKYEVMGPAGCGSLSQYSENLSAITGVPNGSVPTASKGYAFEGWYKDANCTIPAEESEINPETNKLTPVKAEGAIWANSTVYYAKFIALTTDAIIGVAAADEEDAQTFIFKVKGKADTDTADVDLTVTVTGNGKVTIKDLPVGEYTITELDNWSWRYDSATPVMNVTLSQDKSLNVFLFDHVRSNGSWLDGNAEITNVFARN